MLGFIGFILGEVIGKFMRPDMMMGSSSINLALWKLFWMVGPQLIRAIGGSVFGISIVATLFGVKAI